MGRGLRKDIGDPLKEVTLLDLALNLRRRWKRLLVEVLTTYNLHPTAYSLQPTAYTLQPTPYTLHPTAYSKP
jgi:hypothetical protein